MVRTFLKVYMELGYYFLFLQEQIKYIIPGSKPRSKDDLGEIDIWAGL
jgi:hypothetical protein